MLKRKKPRQNSASTSPSSSPPLPNSGLSGISLPSDISLNQQKQSQLQQDNINNNQTQEIQQDIKNKDNSIDNINNKDSGNNNNKDNIDINKDNSSINKNKNKKKKNKSRDRKSKSSSNSVTSASGSTTSTPLPINNNSGNSHHYSNSSNNNNNSNNSYSKSPSYPKKYQKPNSPNSNTPIEVLTNKPKSYQKIESSSDFDQQIKKEEVAKENSMEKVESLSQPQQSIISSTSSSPILTNTEQPISLHESLKMARQSTATIPSEQNFVPLNLGDDKKSTIIPSQSETNKSFIPINNNNNVNSNNNNTFSNSNNNSYNNNNNSFSYNNSTFNFSKNKYHNNRRNGDKQHSIHVPLWLQNKGYSGRDLHNITLNAEIESFCKWLEPSDYELRVRLKIIREIESIVKSNWPKAKVVVFGSFSSHLFIPSSDIDIQISDINEGIDRYSFQNPIRDFHSLLIKNHQNSFCNVRLISGAKIPIIKMTSVHTQYNIDICFDTPSGIENTQVVKSFLKQYKSMRILLLVLKFFLHQNNLNETYTGGIGSYALALMVVSYIQLRHVPLNHKMTPHSKARKDYKHAGDATDYGLMLIEFFELYGRIFNYSLHGISLENGGYYFKKDEIKALGAGLTLIDPHDSENDVGKNSFNIPFIRGVFCNSFLRLLSHDMVKEQYGRINFPTLLSRIIEERLVEQFARQRSNVEKYATQLDESGLLPELVPIDDLVVQTPPNSESFINNNQLKNNNSKEKEKVNSVINISSSDEEEIVASNKNNNSKDKIISGGSNAHCNSDSIKIFDKKIIKENSENSESNNNDNNNNNTNNINNNNNSSGEEFSEDSNQSQNESSDVHSSDSNFSSSYEYSDSEFDGSNSCSSDNIHEDESDGGNSKNNSQRQKLVDPIGFEW